MKPKDDLKRQLRQLRNREYYSRLIRITLLSIFVILTPIVIYDKFQEKDYITVIALLIADLIFIGIIRLLYKAAKEYYSLNNSRVYQSIENPAAVTEIVVSADKIIFEIKGMEDETFFLKHTKFREKLLTNIKVVFGENKIALVNNP